MTASALDVQQLSINTIRTLSMDAVQQANSGHPGTPMALAPVTYVLFRDFLKFDPDNADWLARDRFVLSCGHASMLLYSVLHLAQVKKTDGSGELGISLEDIKNFRQWHSPCAGHPEFGEAPGIETTTGPLGQGIATSVGMAAASKWMGERYGQGSDLVDYNVYALCSDGDIMEGIGSEAASMAGHMGLSNLCWIYDDNQITIEGRTDLAFSEDVGKRFESMGWNVLQVDDANDLEAIANALRGFQSESEKPTFIVLKSIIGYGAPNKQDTASAHGSPLGEDEIKLAKESYGWPVDNKFDVPESVLQHFAETVGARGQKEFSAWTEKWNQLQTEHPTAYAALNTIKKGELPENWEASIPSFAADEKGMATRASSGKVINGIAANIPWLLGGSADLAGSTKTIIDAEDAGHFNRGSFGGRNFHFGIREHGMAAMANGMALSGLRPYVATFFVFTDYLRPAMRLSALMKQPVIYVLTHDSIGLGEDGPTHQPIEHLAACRAIPNLLVMRPADANEVAACYQAALVESDRPTAMVLTRQNTPTLDREKFSDASGAGCGGYVVAPCDGEPDTILMGTGSELELCLDAAEKLTAQGKKVQVVSLPCFELFDEQPEEYREEVLPSNVTNRVAVEAGIQMGWDNYIGPQGHFVGMNRFGASAPYQRLYQEFGITVDRIVELASR